MKVFYFSFSFFSRPY